MGEQSSGGRPVAPKEPLDASVMGFYNPMYSGGQAGKKAVQLEQNPTFQM